MERDDAIRVEVVYAQPREQTVVTLTMPAGSSVEEAVALSGLRTRFPDLETARLGVYGRVVPANTVLSDGDRVEIYRPLIADAKHARRRRAAR